MKKKSSQRKKTTKKKASKAKKTTAKKKTIKKKFKKKKKRFLKKELNAYREKLLNLKDDLMKQIQEISDESLRKSQQEASGDISAYSLHLADRASDSYERDFNLGLVSSERRIVMEIDEALKRIDEKQYGFCQMCKKPIAKRRLDAIPYARYGTKCQKKIEEEER
ncbi:MAG: TraR/DksA family transcriptional regulator [Candidatus Omnitrophica bacterium]|nr:TraR/DksA family transcriptional regulator [Candidatus Omnitrophota bacterium]MCF7894046.1 TraR/DksA family transcriptional regulator [Candidatus Omnitrophota bacterium]